MQVIGSWIMQAWTPDANASSPTETIRLAVGEHVEGRTHRLVQLTDPEQEAIASSIARDLELCECDEPTLPAA